MKVLLAVFSALIAWPTMAQSESFGPPILLDDNVDFAFKVASLDVNSDGFPDVVAAAYTSGQLTLYINDGTGGFSDGTVFFGPDGNIPNITTADIDGDLDQDLVANVYGNKVYWFPNMGDGTFDEPIEVSALGEAWQPHGLDTGDLDYDGDIDVVIGNYTGDLLWYENNGSGTFIDIHTLATDIDFLVGVEAADLTGDGAPEVIYGSTTEDAYFWMENDGLGSFSDPITLVGGLDYAERTESADLDNDGDIDIVCSHGTENPGNIVWMRNEGGGLFTYQSIDHISVSGAGIDARTLSIADMDLDGNLDILSSSLYSNGYSFEGDASGCFWFKNLGAGIFDSPEVLLSFSDATGGAGGIVTADVDGDSDLDVLTAWRVNNYVTLHINEIGGGCMDPTACNYSDGNWAEDGSCCYTNCGCTDATSLNYEPGAVCDDGSCSYLISGVVYYDANENGYLNSTEYGLPFQEVTLTPSGLTLVTNDEGVFYGRGWSRNRSGGSNSHN